MARKVVAHKTKGESITKRIELFIAKLSGMDTSSRESSNAITNELRYIRSNYKALNTQRGYMTLYREAIGLKLSYHHTFEAAAAKVIKKFPEYAQLLSTEGSTPLDTMRAVKAEYLQLKKNGQSIDGRYDALRKLKINHPAYYRMKLKEGEGAAVSQAAETQVNAGKAEKLSIPKSVIDNAVAEGMASNSIYKRAVALMLCSGRRPVELFKLAAFELVDDVKVKFSGQAKAKYSEARDNYSIEIVGVSASEFIKKFNEFRSWVNSAERVKNGQAYKDKTNRQVNAAISSDIGGHARKMLLNDDATFYTCRHLWGELVWLEHGEGDKQVFLSARLGHGKDDLKTVHAYEDVAISGMTIDEAKQQYKTASKKRERVKPLGVTKVKAEKVTKAQASRADKMKEFNEQAEGLGRAVTGLHAWAIEQLEADPQVELTQTYITKAKGTSRPAIKKWLELVGVELATMKSE